MTSLEEALARAAARARFDFTRDTTRWLRQLFDQRKEATNDDHE